MNGIFEILAKGLDLFTTLFRLKNNPEIVKNESAKNEDKAKDKVISDIKDKNVDNVRKSLSS
jgi:hypothetical protein